jgi:peptidoglycan/LPS O-acetylase OafA/YrhL
MDARTPIDPRYRSLDVWRGLACLMVLIDHVAIPWFGNADTPGVGTLDTWLRTMTVQGTRLALGPPMFFVMSGYCIAASTDSLRRKGKSPREFLVRRLWRTFPPYWIALGLTVLVLVGLDAAGLSLLYRAAHGWLPSPSELDWPRWIGNLTLTETWRPRVWGRYEIHVTGTSWTLCYQEQFYMVCFLAVLLSPRRLYRMWAGVTVASVLVRLVLWDIGWWPRAEGFFLTYWHEFAVGLAVYWRLNAAETALARRAVELGLAGLAVVGFAAGGGSTAAAGAFGLLMIALRPQDARLGATPVLAPVRACGKRCYSIYLTHMPICILAASALDWLGVGHFWAKVLIGVPVVSAVAVAFAWLFYDLVESRFLEPPKLRRAASSRACPAPGPLVPAAT